MIHYKKNTCLCCCSVHTNTYQYIMFNIYLIHFNIYNISWYLIPWDHCRSTRIMFQYMSIHANTCQYKPQYTPKRSSGWKPVCWTKIRYMPYMPIHTNAHHNTYQIYTNTWLVQHTGFGPLGYVLACIVACIGLYCASVGHVLWNDTSQYWHIFQYTGIPQHAIQSIYTMQTNTCK